MPTLLSPSSFTEEDYELEKVRDEPVSLFVRGINKYEAPKGFGYQKRLHHPKRKLLEEYMAGFADESLYYPQGSLMVDLCDYEDRSQTQFISAADLDFQAERMDALRGSYLAHLRRNSRLCLSVLSLSIFLFVLFCVAVGLIFQRYVIAGDVALISLILSFCFWLMTVVGPEKHVQRVTGLAKAH